MKSRFLPIINAIGCLVITSLVVVQWQAERASDAAIAKLRRELAESREQTAEESRRRSALERDITVLKEALEATQQAAESATRESAEHQERASRLSGEVDAARDQVTLWETAIAERDERIRKLDSDLKETRERLDQAVERLKAAGAR
jgi:chromosome segregation ATPase